MNAPGPQGSTMTSFLEQVQQRSGVATYEEADRLARATVSALSERVTRAQAEELAPALPPELRTEITRHTDQAQAFDKTTFIDRISGEIDTVDLDEAERQTRAVLTVLRQWAPSDDINDTVAQLPPDLASMFR